MIKKDFFASYVCLLLITLLIFIAVPLYAFNSPNMPKDLEKLRQTGQLRVAVLKMGAPPFVIEKNGKLSGADVDMTRDIAANLGVKAVFVRVAGGYDALIQTVAENKADIAICELSKTLKRAASVFFSRPYIASGYTLVVNRLSASRAQRAARVTTPEDFDPISALNKPGISISTMSGSITVDMMHQRFSKAELSLTKSYSESALRVYEGEVDAAILADSAYLSIVHDMPALTYKVKAYSMHIYDPLAIAVQPGLPDLLRWINDYLDVTADQRTTNLADLVRRYMGEPIAEPLADAPGIEDETQSQDDSNWWIFLAVHVIGMSLIWFLAVRGAPDRRWLKHPLVVIGGMVLGGAAGYLQPSLASVSAPLAAIYLKFWRLCVLPIMIATVVTSIYRLLTTGDNSRLIKRLLVVIPSVLLIMAFTGFMSGLLGRPGVNFSQKAQQMLVKDVPANINAADDHAVFQQIVKMAEKIIPDNPLKPIVENQNLAVLFIALAFGIMLAKSRVEGRAGIVRTLDAVLEVFTGLIKASLYLLPFALYALALGFIATMGLDLLGAILHLAICLFLSLMVPFCFSLFMLHYRLHADFKNIFHNFGPMLLAAFSARSSIIAMPLGIEALKKYDDIDHDQAMAVFPLSLLACHGGLAVFFSLIPMFIGQAFEVDFTLGQYAFLILGAMLSVTAAIGSIGPSYVMLLSVVCGMAGLPLEPAVQVGLALMAVMAPFNATIQIFFSCGITTLLVESGSSIKQEASLAETGRTDQCIN